MLRENFMLCSNIIPINVEIIYVYLSRRNLNALESRSTVSLNALGP